MNPEARQRALEEIHENITRFGYHLYVVSGDQQPRYVYTIGLSPKLGYELVFAGGILFMYKEVSRIIARIVEQLTANSTAEVNPCSVDPFGNFSFRSCDPSWTALLMLGVIDFYQRPDVPAMQIVPDDEHFSSPESSRPQRLLAEVKLGSEDPLVWFRVPRLFLPR